MPLNKPLIAELKHEAGNTRKMLERVPFENTTWKPHAKSREVIQLATHVATVLRWVKRAIEMDEFDLAAPNNLQVIEPKNSGELLDLFNKTGADAEQALENVSDETLMKPWTFRSGQHVVFTMPKAAVIRNMAFNHYIHHRGQLSVYLRLLDVPIPGMYGPSADEK